MIENDLRENNGPEPENAPAKAKWTTIPYVLAIAVLIAYGFFIYFLTGKAGTDNPVVWSRLVYLFSGMEAIVFAAAGFLFGREVNRKRAENAESERKQAERKKEEAERKKEEAERQKEEAKERKEQAEKQASKEREKGLILATMAVQAERMSPPTADKSAALEGMIPDRNPLAGIANTAKRMYPELEGK